ncbi:MAG: tRNA threonylcarbamoyladenosine dehydratase [Deltaproteobacteria bacterium]|nr:MAG: tRNA threonylcarbamoyladenosine dehydratase [Deltaproteobacteria bacterium]
MNDDYGTRFGGIARLYGVEGLERLRAARVMVIGIGGVGSWVAEALARSGVGALDLVDLDDVCLTNTNRQLHALTATVGRPKIEVMAERVATIAPECKVTPVHDFFTASNSVELIDPGLSWVVDAIDGFRHKVELITRCHEAGVPLVTMGGAGGRRDPTRVQVADLAESEGDRLLHRVRKELRQKRGYSRKGRWNIPCVFSAEPPVFPTPEGGVCETRDQADTLRLDCASGFGTASFLTGAFGLAAASVVVSGLAEGKRTLQRPNRGR